MKATFTALKAAAEEQYIFDVEMPSGDMMEVIMRPPTSAEIAAWERRLPPMPNLEQPKYFKEFGPMGSDGKPEKRYDRQNQDYLDEMSTWVVYQRNAQILLCWAENVPGETVDEQMQELNELPNWATSALVRCAREVRETGADAIKQRSFHRD